MRNLAAFFFCFVSVGVLLLLTCVHLRHIGPNPFVGNWNNHFDYNADFSENTERNSCMVFYDDKTVALVIETQKVKGVTQQEFHGVYSFDADTLRIRFDDCECVYTYQIGYIDLDLVLLEPAKDCSCPQSYGSWKWVDDIRY